MSKKDLEHCPVIFIDCQTTGASPAKGDLLEISWALGSASSDIESESFLVTQPKDAPIPRRISQLTGIKDDDLSEAVKPTVIKKQLLKLIKSKKPQAIVIHYARFEIGFLQKLLGTDDFPLPVVCTHEIAKRLHPSLPSRGIRALAGYFGESLGEFKRSHCHVEATSLIWSHLTKELSSQSIGTLPELLKWVTETPLPKKGARAYPLAKEKRLSLPNKPGIYRMISKDGKILYIGKATSLKSRVNSYFRGQKKRNPRHLEMLTQVENIDTVETKTITESALLETDEIKTHNPPYNIALKTSGREICYYDRGLTNHAKKHSKTHNIGPYPSSKDLDQLNVLLEAIQSGQLADELLYQQPEEPIFFEGLTLFISENFGDTPPKSIRSLICKGIMFYREDQLIEEEEIEEIEEEGEVEEDFQWTPELVSSFLRGLLKSSGKNYLRNRKLGLIANSVISWKLKTAGWRVLKLEGGEITESASIKHQQIRKYVKFSKLGFPTNIMAFDRLRVLKTEIDRIASEGRKIKLFFGN